MNVWSPSCEKAENSVVTQGGANTTHKSDPVYDTADFSDALFRLTGVFDFAAWGPVGGFPTSDHRLVWTDLDLPGRDG